ncbi:hypothetical protein [Kitasatospora acidiphila]|uniref:hypothetical protein n=1 Tax=Kitasatospora acidiphila TaxID=2567942 RepID=UPI003C7360BE
MRGLVRRIAPVLAAVTMAGGVTLASATNASASGWGCSGNEVSGSPYAVPATGTAFSYVHLFWDASTGQNCAVNVKAGSLYGVSTYTGITLIECSQTVGGGACTAIDENDDWKNYSYYAGPVHVSAAGQCIGIVAETENTANVSALWQSPAFHCG